MCERYIDWLPLKCPQMGTWAATQACALTGNRTGDPLTHRLTLSPLSHTSQGSVSIFLVPTIDNPHKTRTGMSCARWYSIQKYFSLDIVPTFCTKSLKPGINFTLPEQLISYQPHFRCSAVPCSSCPGQSWWLRGQGLQDQPLGRERTQRALGRFKYAKPTSAFEAVCIRPWFPFPLTAFNYIGFLRELRVKNVYPYLPPRNFEKIQTNK